MSEIGHNRPPSQIETVGDVAASLNDWMKDHPVIETEDAARDAKILLDRGKLCLKDLDAERDKLVRPLNETVEAINGKYRAPRNLLKKITDEVLRRVTDFLAKEEAKRIKIAEEARKKAEEAERLAREAEAREAEVIADAKHGVEVDVAAAAQAADASYQDYRRADRLAVRTEREAKVRLGGGFSRSLSLKNKETLTVKDAISAINAIGMTPDIEAAILKAARAYRTMSGDLPPGIESTTERAA